MSRTLFSVEHPLYVLIYLLLGKDSNKVESDVINSQWYQEGLRRVSLDYGKTYKNSNGENVITASGIIDDVSSKIRVMAADIMC